MDKVDRDKSVFENQKEDVQRGLERKGRPTRPDWLWDDENDFVKEWANTCGLLRDYIEHLEQSACDALAVLDNMEEEFPMSKADLNMIRGWLGMAESEFESLTNDFTEDWKLMNRIERHYEIPEEPAPVYHWTTAENARKILREGLNVSSFICRNMNDYHGEVCLEISGVSIDWEHREPDAEWQTIAREHIPPDRIKMVGAPADVGCPQSDHVGGTEPPHCTICGHGYHEHHHKGDGGCQHRDWINQGVCSCSTYIAHQPPKESQTITEEMAAAGLERHFDSKTVKPNKMWEAPARRLDSIRRRKDG